MDVLKLPGVIEWNLKYLRHLNIACKVPQVPYLVCLNGTCEVPQVPGMF